MDIYLKTYVIFIFSRLFMAFIHDFVI